MSGGSGMGWREALARSLYDWDAGINPEPSRQWPEFCNHDPENAAFYETFAGCAHRDLLAMPAPARIALARELLAGVGYHAVVIPDEWDIPGEFGDGWNACRAAMMEE